MKGKPLTEVLAGVYVNELHDLQPEASPPWVNMSDDHRKAHMAAMHSVVKILDLFNIQVTIDGEGSIRTERIEPRNGHEAAPVVEKKTRPILAHGTQLPTDVSPPRMTLRESRQMGFTGDICSECGSLQMVRNGSCLKCQSCGSTTGCS